MRETGVAFVVPVYNKEPHLESVLRQIARQEGDFPRQFVFVDDGSTDRSLGALRDLTAGWDDVVIESQDNRGSAGATNRAIALVRQPYIKFVDADDLIGDFATITLLDVLRDSPACLAYGNVARYRDESEIDLHARVERPAATLIGRPLRLAMTNSLFNPTQSLARTEAVREVGGCDERIVHSQEYSLTLRLAQRWPLLRVDAPVAFLPKETADRLSNDPARQLQRVTQALANFLRDHPETGADLKRFACHRAAGRAWKYVYRHRGLTPMSLPWLWRYLWSYVPGGAEAADFIDTCCAAFEPT